LKRKYIGTEGKSNGPALRDDETITPYLFRIPKKYKARWVIEMREKEGIIPSELTVFDDIVFDGYATPVETLSHSFVCKPIWLKLYRRRYGTAEVCRQGSIMISADNLRLSIQIYICVHLQSFIYHQ
jgi:hypothetical protein